MQRRTLLWPFGKKQWNMTQIAKNQLPKLRRTSQPPLSYPRATPDSDRAKKPHLAEPAATDQELISIASRVWATSEQPTGEFGTI